MVCRAKLEYKVSVVLTHNKSLTNPVGRTVASADLTVLSPVPPRSPRGAQLEQYAQLPVSDCCGCSSCCGDCCVKGTVGTHVGADSEFIVTGGSIGTYSLVWVRSSFVTVCIPLVFESGTVSTND
jgi:hypothetical protein